MVIRLIALSMFLTWRVRNPNEDAMWLWGLSIVCEIWFAFSWILDQLPKLNPINRATDLAALKDKFEQPSPTNPQGRSDLPGFDVFVSTADPEKVFNLIPVIHLMRILVAKILQESFCRPTIFYFIFWYLSQEGYDSCESPYTQKESHPHMQGSNPE